MTVKRRFFAYGNVLDETENRIVCGIVFGRGINAYYFPVISFLEIQIKTEKLADDESVL